MKKLILLIIVLLILLGGYFLLRWITQPDEFVPPEDFKVELWNPDNIDEIRMSFGDDNKIELKRVNDRWLVNDFMANFDRIDQLFKALKDAKVTSRVSTNSQNHERFEVNGNGTGLQLVFNDEIIQDMVVGKSAGGDSVYVRLADQDVVYVLTGLQKYLLPSDLSYWRDRSLITLSKGAIKKISVELDSANWQLFAGEDGWGISSGSLSADTLDVSKVGAWLDTLVNLQASDFPTEEQNSGAKIGNITISDGVEGESGVLQSLLIYASDEEHVLFVQRDDDLTFLTPKTSFDATLLPYNDLIEELKVDEPELDSIEE